MNWRYLGDTIDIHCGGQDLIFPHHENEIAQSECFTGKPELKYRSDGVGGVEIVVHSGDKLLSVFIKSVDNRLIEDLIFPHHENEIAQSECFTGKPFAHYWMHNGYINVDNVKMSKSLGNFFTVRDVAEKYGYEPIRYLLISAQYRSPINYRR